MSNLISLVAFVLVSEASHASATPNPLALPDQEWEGFDGDPGDFNPFSESANWQALIKQFGGRVVNASNYPESPEGFQNFMRDSAVTDYDAIQIITPRSPEVAKKCGIKYLLPRRSKWPRGAAIALWAQALSQVAQEKPVIRNWYRDPCYNREVGGAPASDHLQARSVDLDFASEEGRRRAQKWLCTFWNSKLNMQIGLGQSMIHLGAQSPRGRRSWYYATYRDSDRGKTCFD